MGAEDEVHHPEGFFDALPDRLLLGHAAAHGHDEVGVFLLGVVQGADVPEHAQLRVLPDGAGVHGDHVRLGGVGGEAVAAVHEPAPQDLGVGLVLLAAVGVHQGQMGPVRDGLLYELAVVTLGVHLRRGDLFSDVHFSPRLRCCLLFNISSICDIIKK